MKDYSLYLIDFDGTLFDTLDSLVRVYNAGFRLLGYEITRKEASEYMHVSLEETCEIRKVPMEKRREFSIAIGKALLDREAIHDIHPFIDVIPLLEGLKKKGKRIGIATGNTSAHVLEVLRYWKLDHYFEGIYSGSEIKPKPNPDILIKGMKELGDFSKEQCVYIGDSLQDPLTATNAGIDGILIDRNNEHPDYQGLKINSLASLLEA